MPCCLQTVPWGLAALSALKGLLTDVWLVQIWIWPLKDRKNVGGAGQNQHVTNQICFNCWPTPYCNHKRWIRGFCCDCCQTLSLRIAKSWYRPNLDWAKQPPHKLRYHPLDVAKHQSVRRFACTQLSMAYCSPQVRYAVAQQAWGPPNTKCQCLVQTWLELSWMLHFQCICSVVENVTNL